MSVARAREVVARLRAAGITVHEWPGWESRGNGLTSAYEGLVVHHTASGYGSAFPVLVDGRSDLSGPLCNTSGNADGSVTLVAAHPANHAGAGLGRSMGPLPRTSLFNNRVWGHEIVYPGNQPMTAAQSRTAAILARVCTDVFGYGDIERARAHAETSSEGKWDPGYAPGQTIDMAAFRREAAAATTFTTEDDMPLTPNDGNVPWAAANPYLPDNAPNKVETHPIATWVGAGAFHGLEAVRLGRLTLAAVTEMAKNPDITPAALEEMIRRSDAEHAPVVAGLVAASVNSKISGLVSEALEKVQENDSDADVAALLRQIATLVPAGGA